LSPFAGRKARVADDGIEFREGPPLGYTPAVDERRRSRGRAGGAEGRAPSARLVAEGAIDQLELARLKRRKLRLKDQIQLILDSNTPDIIA
jgi:hypothetical protein